MRIADGKIVSIVMLLVCTDGVPWRFGFPGWLFGWSGFFSEQGKKTGEVSLGEVYGEGVGG